MSKIKLGVIVGLGDNVEDKMRWVHEFGLSTCQLSCWDPNRHNPETVERVKAACREFNIEITSLWAGYPGPVVWNFIEGPTTIGIVPPETREMRTRALLSSADFAAAIGAPSITTHVGFLPESPSDPLWEGAIDALRRVAVRCKGNGLFFNFETGQETPITMLRAFHAIGTDNLGVNLDPANLLMYGKANAVDALDIIGPYVKGVHAKDGVYPSPEDPNRLGKERRIGDGQVNYPVLIPKLKSLGYSGALTIEREISGEQQKIDIQYAIDYLTRLWES